MANDVDMSDEMFGILGLCGVAVSPLFWPLVPGLIGVLIAIEAGDRLTPNLMALMRHRISPKQNPWPPSPDLTKLESLLSELVNLEAKR